MRALVAEDFRQAGVGAVIVPWLVVADAKVVELDLMLPRDPEDRAGDRMPVGPRHEAREPFAILHRMGM